MYAQQTQTAKAQRLRKEAGAWLQEQRKSVGLTQADMAKALGLEWPTEVSAFERGASRVPPHLYAKYAKALKMPLKTFAKRAVQYYDPYVYEALFGK